MLGRARQVLSTMADASRSLGQFLSNEIVPFTPTISSHDDLAEADRSSPSLPLSLNRATHHRSGVGWQSFGQTRRSRPLFKPRDHDVGTRFQDLMRITPRKIRFHQALRQTSLPEGKRLLHTIVMSAENYV